MIAYDSIEALNYFARMIYFADREDGSLVVDQGESIEVRGASVGNRGVSSGKNWPAGLPQLRRELLSAVKCVNAQRSRT